MSFSIGTLDRARLEADRAGYSPAGPAGRGAAAADRHGHPVRGAGGAGAAGALGRRGAAARGGRGLRRRRGGVHLAGWRCTCGARCASTTWTGWRPSGPDLVALHRERFRRGAYQADDERERVEGMVQAAARRCGVTGREPLPGGDAGRPRGPRPAARRPGRERPPRTSSCVCSERGAPTGAAALPTIVASCRADRRRGGRAAGPPWPGGAVGRPPCWSPAGAGRRARRGAVPAPQAPAATD